MVPAKTLEIIGSQRPQREINKYGDYAITGVDLYDLAILAIRFNERMQGDELRDWQNRISLIVSKAAQL